jgi:hypothetical protein
VEGDDRRRGYGRRGQAVARQILRGVRESLTIASQLGRPLEAVNAVLLHLRDACGGCITLNRPYADEPRIVVTVGDREALRRVAWTTSVPDSDTG